MDNLADKKQVARRLGMSVHTLNKWLWKLDLEPARRVDREYVTKRGRRVGRLALYGREQVEQIRKAMKKRGAS